MEGKGETMVKRDTVDTNGGNPLELEGTSEKDAIEPNALEEEEK